MNFLALDTSTHMLTIAVLCDGKEYVKHELAARKQGQFLLPWIEELLEQASIQLNNLDAVFVGIGPGGFTGIRMGVGVAQGLAAAYDLPVVGVSSLHIIAQHALEAFQSDRVIVAQDARMGEVYWGAYQKNDAGLAVHSVSDQLCHPEYVDPPSNVPLYKAKGSWLAVGDAWQVYGDVLQSRCSELEINVEIDCYPHASALLKLGVALFEAGETSKPEALMPVYLRGESAWKTKSSHP